MTKRIPVGVGFAAFAMACADPTMPAPTPLGDAPQLTVTSDNPAYSFPPGFPEGMLPGQVRLCKTVAAGASVPATSFNFTVTDDGTSTGTVLLAAPTLNIPAGGGTDCVIVYRSLVDGPLSQIDNVTITEGADPTSNWSLGAIDTRRLLVASISYSAAHLNDIEDVAQRQVTVRVNDDMARITTFTNVFTPTPPPPPPACDFITFGRLVWEEGTQKVVISGNAGGNAPGGGILGEFHIEVNGVDHHVSTISTYGPIAAPALASGTYTNSRQVTGTDKHGHAVDLRLWDGGEPGKDTDRFWFSIAGASVGDATTGNLIDQGNMQYHPQCRGPQS